MSLKPFTDEEIEIIISNNSKQIIDNIEKKGIEKYNMVTPSLPSMSPEGCKKLMDCFKEETMFDGIERIKTPEPNDFENMCVLNEFSIKIEKENSNKRKRTEDNSAQPKIYYTRYRKKNKSVSYNLRNLK